MELLKSYLNKKKYILEITVDKNSIYSSGQIII